MVEIFTDAEVPDEGMPTALLVLVGLRPSSRKGLNSTFMVMSCGWSGLLSHRVGRQKSQVLYNFDGLLNLFLSVFEQSSASGPAGAVFSSGL
jgi:hypothetical protein